jgi:hypothetical protein
MVILNHHQFPSLLDDEFITSSGINDPGDERFCTKSIGIHLFHFRRLQSEMYNILYEKPWLASPPLDLDQWQTQMRDRLWKWYRECPKGNNLNNEARINLENFELSLYRALVFLFSPSPNIPDPSEAALIELSEAATRVIQVYPQCFREYRLTLLWQAVENLSSAGTSLLYSYQESAAVRERITIPSLSSLVQTCSSVLWGMVEHFPAFKGKRDAFDILTSAAMADITGNVERETLLSEWQNRGNGGMFGAGNIGIFLPDGFLHNELFDMGPEDFSNIM